MGFFKFKIHGQFYASLVQTIKRFLFCFSYERVLLYDLTAVNT